jgi:carbamoyl-phosphate synthase large subunit
MKATGEVMAIARSFEESLLKAIRSLELKISYPYQSLLQASSDKELEDKITYADDERIFAIFELLRRGYTLQKIQDITKIDTWFIHKMANIIEVEKSLITHRSSEVIEKALKIGFSKEVINQLTQTKNDFSLYRWRKCFKMVDTCAAEFSASSPYFYSTSEFSDDLPPAESDKKIVVLGSGPIRIGQGIEFDYASVHAAMILKEQGYKSIIINNNPETVSTDFSISDALYFDPLHVEDVLDILAREKPMGVIAQFGGQTAINLAKAVENAGYQILGTSVASIDMAEDRKQFENLLRELEIVQPLGKTVTNIHEAKAIAQELGFPLMVRPSYVLGGRAMEIVNNIDELQNYLSVAVTINQDSPVLIDRYIIGKEIEVDAICDGENILIPGIMEHIERAGVHSGDSMAVYPPVNLKDEIINEIIRITQKISLGLKAVGLINIQFVLKSNQLYVIEVNPRASRTVPFLSKITGVSMAKVATLCCLGINLKQQGFNQVILPCPKNYFFVKAPVFSAAKLSDVETALGPEMRSTGEVMGIGRSFEEAILKALEATGIKIPSHGKIMLTVADKHKNKVIKFAQRLSRLGFDFMATKGTYKSLVSNNLKSELVSKIDQSGLTIIDAIKSNQVCLIINTLSKDKKVGTDGFKLRRAAAESGIPCFTSLDTFEAILSSLELTRMNITDINRINKQ